MGKVISSVNEAEAIPMAFGADQSPITPVSNLNPLPTFGSTPYNESSTPLAANATFIGAARDSGAVSGANNNLGYFNALVFADQTGTFSIEGSWDNITFTKVAPGAVSVSTPLTLQIPVMFRYHRVKLINGASAQGVLQISSSYTAS